MKHFLKKHSVLLLLLLSGSLFAQDAAFEKLSGDLGNRMTAAYYDKDPVTFKKEMDSLLMAYSKLSATNKKYYADVLTDNYYNLACTYAITGHKKQAIDALGKSLYTNYRHMQEDSDLDNLRREPGFKKCLEYARVHGDYLYMLRHASPYSGKSNEDLPAFTYEAPDYIKLKKLRAHYNLDSVAGPQADEVLQIINLMRWVHNMVPHDGSKGNPSRKNALSMLKVCRRDGLTLNCRGLATVLNEVYLAMGIPARLVTCLPKNPNDNDCHVINVAWSASLHKWLWMDPTFMAYVMDENGDPLSIEEVRFRLVHNKPLVLNADANRNNMVRQGKADYLQSYMAKNLYKLQCPATSEFDFETPIKDKNRVYINLVPGNEMREHYTSARRDGMNTYTQYYSSNPTAFWAPPPGNSRADYDKAMKAFCDNYNAGNDAAVSTSFAPIWHTGKTDVWPEGRIGGLKNTYGSIHSCRYMGISKEDGVALYKLVCDRSTHACGMTLDRDGKFLTFRFHTSSPEISQMMAATK